MNYDTAIVAALLTSLAEMPDDYIGREGLLYAPFMDKGLEPFQHSVAVCVKVGYLKRHPNHGLSITEDGRAMAKVIEERLAAKGC